MFFVYFGYVSPDNYDSSEEPTYKLIALDSEEKVLKLKKEFEENIHDECGNVIFRVIKGSELSLKPVKIVTEWKLE